MLADLDRAAVKRAKEIIETAGAREAADMIKLVWARTRPEPRPQTALPAAAIAGAVAGQMSVVLTKAAQRATTRELQGQTVTDATFTPLGRVQKGE